MKAKRQIEIFSAGCPLCSETEEMVRRMACDDCEVTVRDMSDAKIVARAKKLAISAVPAVVVDGKLSNCCKGKGPDEAMLRAAGVGQAL